MRAVVGLVAWLAVASASVAAPGLELHSRDQAMTWIAQYRTKPQPALLPDLVRGVSAMGVFNDPESAGAYVGFIAGVLGSNPSRAERLIEAMLPIRTEDHWVIVRAVAYSGLPEWKTLLRQFAGRMPTRRPMIDKFVDGRIPTLMQAAPDKAPEFGDRMKRLFSGEKKERTMTWALEASPELLDTLWGYYFATGSYGPIYRMIAMLHWSKDSDNAEKLTIGSMTKYTLAVNATRDHQLLAMLRRAQAHQPKRIGAVLAEVIDAAENADTVKIRKEQLAAIEDLKRRGPGSRRKLSGWGQLGEGAIGVGCVTAAVMSMTALGIPCVVGGAATSAALRYWSSQQ